MEDSKNWKSLEPKEHKYTDDGPYSEFKRYANIYGGNVLSIQIRVMRVLKNTGWKMQTEETHLAFSMCKILYSLK